ncbi:hypothetical protein E2320_021001 [Naja naja]|nr:hypothetical protein E2320_021001 [Naja naja]
MEAKINSNSWVLVDYFTLWTYVLQDSSHSCIELWLGSGNQSLTVPLAIPERPSFPVILLPPLACPKFDFALQDLLSQSTQPLFELPVYLGKLDVDFEVWALSVWNNLLLDMGTLACESKLGRFRSSFTAKTSPNI